LKRVGLELDHDDINRGESRVCHDDCVGYHTAKEHLSCSLGPVAHAEDKLQANKEDTCVTEDHEDILPNVVAEWVDSWVSERTRDEIEDQVEVGEGEVGEEEGYELVNEFDVKEDLACDGMIRRPYLPEMDE